MATKHYKNGQILKKAILIISIILLMTGCSEKKELEPINTSQEETIKIPDRIPTWQEKIKGYEINKSGMTIEERYPAPEEYTRVNVLENSFDNFLRQQKLKAYGEKVRYYNNREKNNKGVYDSAFDVDIGERDLHQCADAIMLLRAEYLYSQEKYDDISFDFVSGFKAEYSKWREGYRIKVDGNNVSYYKQAEPSYSYESFRKYMDMVMAYASTLSLEKELQNVAIDDMEIGDVFIIGGSPGHAVIVVDMALNPENEKVFLLAQSYMPAQQTQILINPMDSSISPWYSLKGKEKLKTPEWSFEFDDLKRFED